jgi:hypothetical protein
METEWTQRPDHQPATPAWAGAGAPSADGPEGEQGVPPQGGAPAPAAGAGGAPSGEVVAPGEPAGAGQVAAGSAAPSVGDQDAPVGTDPGDAAEESAHRAAVDEVDALLDEVERALARLDDGTYGRCETCGTLIDDEVLAADPVIRHCASCVAGEGGTAGDGAPGASAPAAF